MIHAGRVRIVHGQDVVVFHAVFVAVVVILSIVGNVVGGINIDFSIENMGGGIRCENMGDQRLALFAHPGALLCWFSPIIDNQSILRNKRTRKVVRTDYFTIP